MPIYKAPFRDQQFVIHEVLGAVDMLKALPRYADLDADTINQVVEEAGKFCEELLLPVNQSGDAEGCTYDVASRSVKTPRGFKEAYEAFCAAGWPGLAGETEYGGQGLPHLLQIAFYEMQYSTNQAWAMYPGLTIGAYECLLLHGTDEQKNLYLPKLTSGQWTGTMCLTEPHCGTDLGMLRTQGRAAGRRQLSPDRRQDLHLVGRARPGREHRPPGARAPAGRAAGHQGHLAVHRAEVLARRRGRGREGRRAQRLVLRRHRTQDGHPRQRHLPDEPGSGRPAGWSGSRTRA